MTESMFSILRKGSSYIRPMPHDEATLEKKKEELKHIHQGLKEWQTLAGKNVIETNIVVFDTSMENFSQYVPDGVKSLIIIERDCQKGDFTARFGVDDLGNEYIFWKRYDSTNYDPYDLLKLGTNSHSFLMNEFGKAVSAAGKFGSEEMLKAGITPKGFRKVLEQEIFSIKSQIKPISIRIPSPPKN